MTPYSGNFNDGRHAGRQDVTVHFDADTLRILNSDGYEIERWPYVELRLLDEASSDRPVRLKCGDDGAARLTVVDPRIISELATRAPNLSRRGRSRLGVLRNVALGILGLVVFVAVTWYALPGFSRWAAHQVPLAWEETLGERAMEQTMAALELFTGEKPKFCSQEEGVSALDGVTERLAAAADAPYRFRVLVLDFKFVNAFALPGGRVVFFRGLIDEAESAEEVAGVLAHEMAHITERHGTEGLLRSLGLEMIFGLMLGDLGEGLFGSIGETLLSLSYSREAEATADREAIALLGGADIRADGMAAFFERLAEGEWEMPAALQLLSSHPRHDARRQLFDQASGRGGAAMSDADWSALQGICGA